MSSTIEKQSTSEPLDSTQMTGRREFGPDLLGKEHVSVVSSRLDRFQFPLTEVARWCDTGPSITSGVGFTGMEFTRRRLALALALAATTPAASPDVILQYFESRWETIERRMPDIFMACYDALWVPPPGRADTGGFSVGYDCFDRFDLGSGTNRTLYGTEAGLRQLIREAHRAGILVYPDLVLNHNGFRDLGTPGFVAAGDYPGFAVTTPGDIDGDFHGRYEGGDWNGRTSGLIDIAQEKNHVFIRHPVTPGNPQNIPNETPRESNRRFYPDTDFNSPAHLGNTSGDVHTPSGFNLTRPEAGDPVPENATGLLLRHIRWMREVIGADGFRIDAMKHIPQWFYDNYYDAALAASGSPFSFGEAFDTSFGLLASYTRKDGFGNRDVLDFPLFYAMLSVFNANGYGNMADLEFASFDGQDGNFNDGSRGVMFVQSHDSFGPEESNLAHAHLLTRTGYPIVYFNAREFGNNRDFPKDGRGDALGGQFGDRILRLLDINEEHVRGAHHTRHADSDVYIYERANACLVGLNDNEAFAANRSVFNLAFRNVTLVELTGNPGASPTVNVDGAGNASVTIPSNGSSRGYAVWGLPRPRGITSGAPFTISPVASVIAPDPSTASNATRRLTPIEVVTANSATLTLQLEDEGLDDQAILRVDNGAVDALGTPYQGGQFTAYQAFASASPSFGGGTGVYATTLNTAALGEGFHYLSAIAFVHRSSGSLPPIWETFRKVIYVDRVPPPMTLRFPGQTGSGDVQSSEYEVVLDCTDATANTVHVLADFAGDDAAALAAVSAANRASRVDRAEFRFGWTGITPGIHSLTAVAFEETGNASVTRFNNIGASIPTPAATFANLPAVITSREFNDIQISVDFLRAGGPPHYTFDPAGLAPHSFNLQLTVDGVTYPAQAYSPGLVGSLNTLYQNDTNLGDNFDTFRFNWRGYSRGFHQFQASAELNDGSLPPAIVTRTIEVPQSVAGPGFTITSPPPPAPGGLPNLLLIEPPSISVTVENISAEARSLTAYLDAGQGEILMQSVDFASPPASVTLTSSSSEEFRNGRATIRVIAGTGPGAAGITEERSTHVLILGAADHVPSLTAMSVDGQPSDWTGTPPSQIHTAAVSGLEWIYTGDIADSRTDLGDDTNIANTSDLGDRNMDLTELRIRPTETDLHFLARYRDVTNVNRPSFAIAFDTNEPGDTTSVSFIGDNSETLLDTVGRTYDYTTQVHFTTADFSRVEVFDDVGPATWFSPSGERTHVSAANSLIEFSIPRAALGLAGPGPRTVHIQAATFENVVGWNNDIESSRGIVGSADALDVLGGQPGVSQNAYGRATLVDGIIDNTGNPSVVLTYAIVIPGPESSGSIPPPDLITVSPGDGSTFPTATPQAVTIETDLAANAVLLAVNGQLVEATLTGESGGVRTWSVTTPMMAQGANAVVAAAFSNSNLTGRTSYLLLTYSATTVPAELSVFTAE